jgi:hypothetical protein
MRLLEKLAGQTGYMGRTTKPSITGGNLILTYVDWNSNTEKSRGTQVFLNRLVWEIGYTQVVNGPTRRDALLTFTFSGPKVSSPLTIMFRGSVFIAGYYWKQNEEKISLSIK